MNFVNFLGRAQAKMKRARARGSITSRSGYMIELGLSSGEHSHFRPNRVAIAFGTLQGQLQPVVAVRGALWLRRLAGVEVSY